MPFASLLRPCIQTCELFFSLALKSPAYLYNVWLCTLIWLGVMGSVILGVPRSNVGMVLWGSPLRFRPLDTALQSPA